MMLDDLELGREIFVLLVRLDEAMTRRVAAGGCVCCEGVQLDFPAQQIAGVSEIWVPFEESIAVGWG